MSKVTQKKMIVNFSILKTPICAVFLLINSSFGIKNNLNISHTYPIARFIGYYDSNPVFDNIKTNSLFYEVGDDKKVLYKYRKGYKAISIDNELCIFKENKNVYHIINIINGKNTEITFERPPLKLFLDSKEKRVYYTENNVVCYMDLLTLQNESTHISGNLAHVSENLIYITKESQKDVVYPLVDLYTIEKKNPNMEKLIFKDISGEALYISPKEDFLMDKILSEGSYKLFKVHFDSGRRERINEKKKYYYSYQIKGLVFYD